MDLGVLPPPMWGSCIAIANCSRIVPVLMSTAWTALGCHRLIYYLYMGLSLENHKLDWLQIELASGHCNQCNHFGGHTIGRPWTVSTGLWNWSVCVCVCFSISVRALQTTVSLSVCTQVWKDRVGRECWPPMKCMQIIPFWALGLFAYNDCHLCLYNIGLHTWMPYPYGICKPNLIYVFLKDVLNHS